MKSQLKKYKLLLIYIFINVLLISLGASHTTDESPTIHQGVIDRMNEDVTVILIEDIHEQCLIATADVPEGSKEQLWVNVTLTRDEKTCHVLEIDQETTRSEQERSKRILEELRRKK